VPHLGSSKLRFATRCGISSIRTFTLTFTYIIGVYTAIRLLLLLLLLPEA